jgi:hypothetical protein
MAYAEAGDRLGVSPEAVRAKAARKRWRRQIGNDGLARIMIPGDLAVTTRAHGAGDRSVTLRSPTGRKAVDPALVAALESHIKTLHGENEVLKQQLAAADARDAQHAADLAAERAQTQKAIATFSAVEQLLDVLAAERAKPWWRRLVG